MKSVNVIRSRVKIGNLQNGTKEARCHCGHLMARLCKEGVELKCKRCKRIVILPLNANGTEEYAFSPCPA